MQNCFKMTTSSTGNISKSPLKSKITSQWRKDELDDNDVIDDLINQFSKEENVQESDTSETQDTVIQHFNNEYDALLLSKLGLNIVLDPLSELNLPPNKVNASRILAHKFSKLLLESGLIYKAPEKEQMNKKFTELLNLVNGLIPKESKLQIHDLKRIIFLTTRWHTTLDEKNPILQNQSVYAKYFNFLPKSFRRIYYCEYCTMSFNTQLKLESHRVSHTDSNTMVCGHCMKVFKRKKAFESHEEKCKLKSCLV